MILTTKQKKFAELYAASGNATRSAIGAGYSESTARSIASENLTKPDIIKYVSQLSQDDHDGRIATVAERQEFWTSVVRDPDAEMRDRLRASAILGKAQGDFTELVRSKVSVDMPIAEANRILEEIGIIPENLGG